MSKGSMLSRSTRSRRRSTERATSATALSTSGIASGENQSPDEINPSAPSVHTVLPAAYASPIIHVGGLGSALGIKLVNNALLAANLQLLAQAADVASALGTDEATMLQVLTTSSGGSYASRAAAAAGSLQEFTGSAGPFLRKDVAAVRSQAAELGIDLGLLDDAVTRGRLPLS